MSPAERERLLRAAVLVHRALWLRGRLFPQVGLDARAADPVALIARGLIAGWSRWASDPESGAAHAAGEVLADRRRRMRRERPRAQWFDAVNTQGFPRSGTPRLDSEVGEGLEQMSPSVRVALLLWAEGTPDHRIAALLGVGEAELAPSRERVLRDLASRVGWSPDQLRRHLREVADRVRTGGDWELAERVFADLFELAKEPVPFENAIYSTAVDQAVRLRAAHRRRLATRVALGVALVAAGVVWWVTR